MERTATTTTRAFEIEALEGRCSPEAEQLWKELHGPVCAATHPTVCLLAREGETRRLLGVAQYFRTFPPEEACGAVVLIPEARHSGVGSGLLGHMLDHATHSGIRTLSTVIEGEDVATMELLRAAKLPVQITRTNGRLYVEIDALHSRAGARQDKNEEEISSAKGSV